VSPGVFYGTTTGSFDPPSGAVVYKLTVNANSAPVAQDDGYQTSEDTALQASAPGVLANDNDADPLQAVLVSGPTHGSLMLNADGSFTYSPAANYNGQDSFTYQASDGQLNSQTATVSIEVVAVNDVPIAAADVATTKKNVSIVISVEGNDTDIDGDALQVLLPSFNTAKKGKVTTDGTTITYTPKKGFTGTDSFTYQVTDGQATSNSATVTVTVTK
jgi:VCBS repeat-containing protein